MCFFTTMIQNRGIFVSKEKLKKGQSVFEGYVIFLKAMSRAKRLRTLKFSVLGKTLVGVLLLGVYRGDKK